MAILAPLAALALAALAPPAGAAGVERLIAPVSACPGQTDPRASLAARERAMRCLTNFARRGRGLDPMAASPALDRAARHKSADILRCDSFSHEACGRPFTHWMQRFADCDGAAENIAWGSGGLGDARSIFRSWMRSSGHRQNILGPYGEIGIGLAVGRFEGQAGAQVWTQNFGDDC
jgi:uncharacterized protein YkwD